MSRKGNLLANALVESFIKTMKSEGVHLREYRIIEEEQIRIPCFIEDVNYQRRLHSSFYYRPIGKNEFLLESTPNPCQKTLMRVI
jgi:transposase InsO family protein